MEDKIKEVLDSIRPYINSDGGDIEFIKYVDGYVYIKLHGACSGCDFADETIQNGIYESLVNEIPEIKGVIKVDL